jgi:hypothetical protein
MSSIKTIQRLDIFISSPSDVSPERKIVLRDSDEKPASNVQNLPLVSEDQLATGEIEAVPTDFPDWLTDTNADADTTETPDWLTDLAAMDAQTPTDTGWGEFQQGDMPELVQQWKDKQPEKPDLAVVDDRNLTPRPFPPAIEKYREALDDQLQNVHTTSDSPVDLETPEPPNPKKRNAGLKTTLAVILVVLFVIGIVVTLMYTVDFM